MKNLKVKVSSEAESKDVQELFFELGYTWSGGKDIFDFDIPEYIVNWNNGYITAGDDFDKNRQEITLPELRDLVVLDRNDRKDATHKCETSAQRLGYLASGGIEYIWSYGNSIWFKPKEMNFKSFNIKPIGKKEMKEPKQAEFLVKTDSGYVLQLLDENAGGEDIVRVPDGATAYVNVFEFGKWDACFYNFSKKPPVVRVSDSWSDFNRNYPTLQSLSDDGDVVLWQRETLNDQVTSAEEYREMISNASILGRASVVVDIAQSCSGGASRNASSQGQSDFPLNNHELNHRVAKAFNAVRGTDLNEDDVNYIRELINLTISHYGERK